MDLSAVAYTGDYEDLNNIPEAEHPIFVARNYSLDALTRTASSSINGNSGLWVVNATQNAGQGIPVANFTDFSGGFAPTAVNGEVRLEEGSVARVFRGNDIRYIGRIITNQNPVVSITEANGRLTITQMNGDTSEITLPSGSGGGGTVVIANPTGDGTDTLTKLQVGSTIYNVPQGGTGTDTDSYFIDAWIRTSKGSTVSSSALTSAGTWNNNANAPAFTTKPTDNVAAGTVFDISDLPASASTSDTFDYHHFRRVFTVGETNVPSSAWQYLGQSNHPVPTAGQFLIQAFLRIQSGDVPLNTALTSGGVWDQQAQRFTTKPTENVLGGVVYDRSDLPADAVTSTQYDYWQYNRYYTEGETSVAGSAWWRVGKLDQDPSGGGTTLTPEQIADINRIDDIESAKQDKIENDDGSDPAEGQIAVVDSAGKLVLGTAPSGGGSGATTFDGLTDTPDSKEANKLVATNADGDALEYVDKTPDADTTTKGIVQRATAAMKLQLDQILPSTLPLH